MIFRRFQCTTYHMYSRDLKSDHLKSGLFEGQIFKLKNETFFSVFQMFFENMAAICPDFKWLGFLVSDPIQNFEWDLKSGLFATQPLLDQSRLVRISDPTVQHFLMVAQKWLYIKG